MRRMLVFQHVPHEILGTLDPLLREAGFRIRYVNFGRQHDARPDVDRYHGARRARRPDELRRDLPLPASRRGDRRDPRSHRERNARTRHLPWRAADRPRLGCTGNQAPRKGDRLVRRHADGGRRERSRCSAIFAAPRRFSSGTATPSTSRTARCTSPHRRVARTRLSATGTMSTRLQFHLEVDEPLIARWLHTPVMAREIECLGPGFHPERIMADTHRHIARSLALGQAVFSHYLHMFHTRRRRVPLSSRHPALPGQD